MRVQPTASVAVVITTTTVFVAIIIIAANNFLLFILCVSKKLAWYVRTVVTKIHSFHFHS